MTAQSQGFQAQGPAAKENLDECVTGLNRLGCKVMESDATKLVGHEVRPGDVVAPGTRGNPPLQLAAGFSDVAGLRSTERGIRS